MPLNRNPLAGFPGQDYWQGEPTDLNWRGQGPWNDPAFAAAQRAANEQTQPRPMAPPEMLPMPALTGEQAPMPAQLPFQAAPHLRQVPQMQTPIQGMTLTASQLFGGGSPSPTAPGTAAPPMPQGFMPPSLNGGQRGVPQPIGQQGQAMSPLDSLRQQMETITQLVGRQPQMPYISHSLNVIPGRGMGADIVNVGVDPAGTAAMQGYNTQMASRNQQIEGLLGRLGTMGQQSLGQGGLDLQAIQAMGANGLPGSMAINAQNANVNMAQEQRARAELESRIGQRGLRGQMERFLLSQPGATPEQVSSLMNRAVQSGMFSGDDVTIPPMPGSSPPTAPPPLNRTPLAGMQPPPANNPYAQAAARNPTATPFASIESTLDAVAGVNRAAAPPGQQGATPDRPQRSIGEFLNRLDVAHPGFIRQNWPAIQSYIQNRYGESGYNEAVARANHPRQLSPGRWIPGSSAATALRQIFSGPNDEELGLSALGALLNQQNRTPISGGLMSGVSPGLVR